jgi:hypothetical protein
MTTEQQDGPAPSAPTSAEAAEVLAEIVNAAAKTTGLPCKIQPLVDDRQGSRARRVRDETRPVRPISEDGTGAGMNPTGWSWPGPPA